MSEYEDLLLLSELKFPEALNGCGSQLVKTFDFKEIDSQTRIYYKPYSGDRTGFAFYVVESAGYVCDEKEYASDFDNPTVKVECLFWGKAYFDGIRHLYMGDEATDTEGYLYYPNSRLLAAVFACLKELETLFCREPARP